MLTTSNVLTWGRNTMKACPQCSQHELDRRLHEIKITQRWRRERRRWALYGALPDAIAELDAKWRRYLGMHRSVPPLLACPHDRQVVSMTPVRPQPAVTSPPTLGLDGFEGDPEQIADSALSDLIDLYDDAFAWKPLGYDPLRNITQLHDNASAFELVSQEAAEDALWFEDLDDKDWERINQFCEGEPRWYVEGEDRYAAAHFMAKYTNVDHSLAIEGDDRDHYGRDHLAALRRRHQGAQVVADLRRRWREHPQRIDQWICLTDGVDGVVHAELDSYALDFDEWLERWAPDAIAELDHQLLPKRPQRDPSIRMFHPSLPHKQGRTVPKRAILRVYEDEPLSQLEQELCRRWLRDEYKRRFGEYPVECYVNTNWQPVELVHGAATELPDELLEIPDDVEYETEVYA